jgi:hypothetical protein
MLDFHNLNILADYLDALPEGYKEFDMMFFGITSSGLLLDRPHEMFLYAHCGTAACALGHGPAAGIFPKSEDDDWDVYSKSMFGLTQYSRTWEFCFGSDWENDPKLAAARIRHLLNFGVPKGFVDGSRYITSRWVPAPYISNTRKEPT